MISVIRLSVDILSIIIQHKHKDLNTNKHKYGWCGIYPT